jgi:hypothetical protein
MPEPKTPGTVRSDGRNLGGRPPKTEVEPGIANAIRKNLEIGMPLSLAAEAEGIFRTTAHRWIEADLHVAIDEPKTDKTPAFRYEGGFALLVARAKATGAKNLAVRALQGGKGSGTATWMLERRYHPDYGLVTKVVTATEDDLAGKTTAELEAERDRLLGKRETLRSAEDGE